MLWVSSLCDKAKAEIHKIDSSSAMRRANAVAASAPVAGANGAARLGFLSNSKPASTQPMVPFLSARTLVRPRRRNAAAAMMLRVRPAQLTMTFVALRCFSSSTQRIKSPPGTLMPPGMQNRSYSSGVRTSRTTRSVERSCSDLSSCGVKSGTLRS
jgi:hypothetical protein